MSAVRSGSRVPTRARVASLVLMLATGSACSGSMVAGRAMATGPSGHFSIRNMSNFEICYIYMSPSNYNQWGPDWLGSRETLLPPVQRTFELNTGEYDIQFKDCSRNVIFRRSRVTIHDRDVLVFRESIIEPQTLSPQQGYERHRCLPNGVCNAGLACMSDVCVRPPDAGGSPSSEASSSLPSGDAGTGDGVGQ